MPAKFIEKTQASNSRIILKMNPVFELLPLPITRYDDPFLPFGKAIISATHDIVAGYFFDFASYLSMGGAGAVALERTIAYVPGTCVSLLHGAFTGQSYSPMADKTGFNLDAITVTTIEDLRYYTQNSPYMAFLTQNNESDIPQSGGLYRTDTNTLHTQGQSFTLTDNTILYASKLDDFSQKVREGLLSLS